MDVFSITDGACGAGAARYEGGLFALPDGSTVGIETVSGIEIGGDVDPPSLPRTTGSLVGALRDRLDLRGSRASLPLPWRLAVSTVRAGLGVVEEGLRPGPDVPVTIAFADGTRLAATMRRELAALLIRDAALVRAALSRPAAPERMLALPAPASDPAGGTPAASEPDASDPATQAALTSIFRYEKRNGRLRRVPVGDSDG